MEYIHISRYLSVDMGDNNGNDRGNNMRKTLTTPADWMTDVCSKKGDTNIGASIRIWCAVKCHHCEMNCNDVWVYCYCRIKKRMRKFSRFSLRFASEDTHVLPFLWEWESILVYSYVITVIILPIHINVFSFYKRLQDRKTRRP